jgi:spermidine synthase
MIPSDGEAEQLAMADHDRSGRAPLVSSAQLPIVALLVFASGCSALVFQMAWMRELRLVFGATTAAASAVLAIFMAGLGIGSAVLGKRADRAADPLRMYGLLEMAIALSVAVTPWLISWISSIYIRLGGQESLGLAGASVARLALAATIMAVPTFLMGGTLPAIVRAVTPPSDVNRRLLGVLYGTNTLGAVFGTAVATFFALERLGTRMTLWAGCAIGLAVGAFAVTWSRRLSSRDAQGHAALEATAIDSSEVKEADDIERTDTDSTSVRPGLIYLTAAILGFTFFALELVWYRMLAPILGGTAFTFGLILCIALFGIAIGGIAYDYVFRRFQPSWSALAITCGCEAVFTILPFALGDRVAFLAARYRGGSTTFLELITGWTYVAAIVILPVAIVSGLQFPLVIALLGHGRRQVSKHVGTTYAWNTLGAITGSLVTGFGAMPVLGALGAWQAIAATLAILSCCILLGAPRIERKAAAVVAGLALVTFGSMFAEGPTAAWRHSAIGVGRTADPSRPNVVHQWMNEFRQTKIWEADGIESGIAIHDHDGLSFVVNGKPDGGALNDAATQIGIATLGAVLHKEPKTALVIGLGTGETAGWLAEMGVEQVDVVELEPALDEMVRRCSELNFNVLAHPRVRRIYNDGREFVLTTKNMYDLVISEPSNPYRAGIAVLYTAEFYEAVRRRLNPDGLFMQWIQAYDVDELTVNTVLATARNVFPHVEVWQTLPEDLQLVCSATPLEHSVDRLRERIASEIIQQALAQTWHVYDLEGFLSHFLAGHQWADAIAQQATLPLNTDDRTLLEYSFARTLGRVGRVSVKAIHNYLAQLGYHRPTLRGNSIDWNLVEMRRQEFNLLYNTQLSPDRLTAPDDIAIVDAFARYRENDFEGVVKRWPEARRIPMGELQRLLLARSYAELGRPDCLELIAASEERFPIEAAALNAVLYSAIGNTGEATRSLVRFYELLRKSPWLIPIVAETALNRTVDVARADRNAAAQLYPYLCQPFASKRFEFKRKLVRFHVAQQLGPEKMVEALAEMEPHVRWTANVLQPRAEVYAAMNHPLAARAQRDWQQFQRDESPK